MQVAVFHCQPPAAPVRGPQQLVRPALCLGMRKGRAYVVLPCHLICRFGWSVLSGARKKQRKPVFHSPSSLA